MNLLLVRHGEIPSNIKKIYAGRSSKNMTERGLVQEKAVSEAQIPYDVKALHSSPIRRLSKQQKLSTRH